MKKIKSCYYNSERRLFEIVTTGNDNRVVTKGELQRSMSDSSGMCYHFEIDERPVMFDEALDILMLCLNREELWRRLEYIMYGNEVKREKALERAAASRIHNTEQRQFVDSERNSIHSTQHHDRIERMNQQLDFNNLKNDAA